MWEGLGRRGLISEASPSPVSRAICVEKHMYVREEVVPG